jgi:anaerobic selenocysteine-containing dehydrogenase
MTKDEGRKTNEGGDASVLRPFGKLRASSSSFVQLTRRRSLRALAATSVTATGAVAFAGCGPPETALKAQSRVRSAEDEVGALEDWYATLCRGCSAGCGTIVRVVEGRAKKVEGNPAHPLNLGKLCARGQAAVQAQYHPDRLTGPLARAGTTAPLLATPVSGTTLVRRGPASRPSPVEWGDALNALAARLSAVRSQGRAGEVVLLTRLLRGSQALVMERFTSAYGAQWLTLDLFGEAPLRAAARRVLGSDRLPNVDLQRARYVLSFGADFLSTWLSPVRYGWEYGVFRQGAIPSPAGGSPPAGRPRGHLVHVDPRFSTTAANADEWVPATPGAEGRLALAIAQVVIAEGLAVPAAAQAFGDPRQLDAYRPEAVTPAAGVSAERIRQIARAFATGGSSVAIAGGSATAHTNGTDTAAAVLALNALVGAIGAPGGVFATPSPLPDVPPPRPASTLAEWQDLIARLQAGRVQAVLVYGANPVYELPAALQFGAALRQAPFIASFASLLDETAQLADLVLPAHLPLEDWGDDVPDPAPAPIYTVQQPVVRPFYDTRSFWDVLLTLAKGLGGDVKAALPWSTFQDVVRATATTLATSSAGPPSVSPANPAGTSSPASLAGADSERYWFSLRQRGGWWPESAGSAATGPEGAQTAALAALRAAAAAFPAPRFAGDPTDYPFSLLPFVHNTLGTGDGAHLPWLQATPDPVTSAVWRTWVELNPAVARKLGVQEGDVVRLRSPQGQIEVPAYVSPAAPPDVLAVPLGQGHDAYGRWAHGRGGDPRALLAPLADEASGALAYAATRVRLEKTGRHAPLPKMEGTVPARQLPGRRVLKVIQS